MATGFAAQLSHQNLNQNQNQNSLCQILNHRAFNVVNPSIEVLKFSSNGFTSLSFRSKKKNKVLQLRQRSFSTSASDSSNRNSIKEVKDGSEANDDAQGPPFLTILAGVLVFSLICWLISSSVVSVIGLVVKLISSK